MATFTWTGQATDTPTSDIEIATDDKINFSGAAFDDAITVGAFQTSTHIENSAAAEQCTTVHLNNTMYVSSQSISINGGANEALANLTDAECPIEINFAHASAVAISDCTFWGYNATTETIGPTDVSIFCAEGGDTDWTSGEGSGTALSIGTSASSTTHDFYIGLSASPDSVGEKTAFTYKIGLTYQ